MRPAAPKQKRTTVELISRRDGDREEHERQCGELWDQFLNCGCQILLYRFCVEVWDSTFIILELLSEPDRSELSTLAHHATRLQVVLRYTRSLDKFVDEWPKSDGQVAWRGGSSYLQAMLRVGYDVEQAMQSVSSSKISMNWVDRLKKALDREHCSIENRSSIRRMREIVKAKIDSECQCRGELTPPRWSLHPDGSVSLDGKSLELEQKEQKVMQYLVISKGEWRSGSKIIDRYPEIGSEATVSRIVRRIRRKLPTGKEQLVQSGPKGYRCESNGV